ncbi:MAG TPA: response regulator transcription factor [Bacteroidota bacterium]|nr:response regulator transcription factor [Bacteroidota bacterium]
MSITVVTIEDHPEFRKGISFVLQTTDGFRCIGEYGSAEEALAEMPKPDVVLLDLNLPGMSGLDAIERLKKRFPGTRILILTVFEDEEHIFPAIVAGADGYILKKTPTARLLQAIEDAVAGGSPMTPMIAKMTLDLFKRFAPRKSPDDPLTSREREILSLLVDGLGNDEISTRLFISVQTVRNHIRHIYEKLHVHSKSQAVIKAIKQGFV